MCLFRRYYKFWRTANRMLILSTDMFSLGGGNKMFAILTELLSTLSAAGQYNILVVISNSDRWSG